MSTLPSRLGLAIARCARVRWSLEDFTARCGGLVLYTEQSPCQGGQKTTFCARYPRGSAIECHKSRSKHALGHADWPPPADRRPISAFNRFLQPAISCAL